MNNRELLDWVRDGSRTQPQLEAAYAGLGLPAPAPTVMADIKTAIESQITTLNPADMAAWSPTPATPPAPAPIAPVTTAPTVPPPVAPTPNPVPTLTNVTPNRLVVGSAATQLTLTGKNFGPSSVVLWNGNPLPATAVTVVNPTTLKATVPQANLASAGTRQVKVRNSAPGGGESAVQVVRVEAAAATTGTPSWLPWAVGAAILLVFGIVGFFLASRLVGGPTSSTPVPTEIASINTPTPVPTETPAPDATETPVSTEAPASTQAPTTGPAPTNTAQPLPEATVPDNFATNGDAIVVTDQNRWPVSDPTGGAPGKFVVVQCQNSMAVYGDATFGTYDEAVSTCLTGVMWFEPTTDVVIPEPTTDPAGPQPTQSVVVGVPPEIADVQLGVCITKSTREQKLDCATNFYFSHGEKLVGIMAYMRSMGATWDDIQVGDPFQPDATPLQNGSPRIWGALLKATNLTVSGNSCLVTDVSSRLATYTWAFVDDRYNPRPSVWHAGEAITSGNLVEIAFHADCSDWAENLAAMEQGGIYRPYSP